MKKTKLVLLLLASFLFSACKETEEAASSLTEVFWNQIPVGALTSVHASLLFQDRGTWDTSLVNEKGETLVEKDTHTILYSSQGEVVVSTNFGCSFGKNGVFQKEEVFYRTPDYGGLYFYKDSMDGLYGVRSNDGSVLLSPCYSLLQWAEDSHYLAKQGEDWVYGNLSERHLLSNLQFEKLLFGDNGLAIFKNPNGTFDLYQEDGARLSGTSFQNYSLENLLLQTTGEDGLHLYDIRASEMLLDPTKLPEEASCKGYDENCYAVLDPQNKNPRFYHRSTEILNASGAFALIAVLNGGFILSSEEGDYFAVRGDGLITPLKNLDPQSFFCPEMGKLQSFYFGIKGGGYSLYSLKNGTVSILPYEELLPHFSSYWCQDDHPSALGWVYRKNSESKIYGILSETGEPIFEKSLQDDEILVSLSHGAVIYSKTNTTIYGPTSEDPLLEITDRVRSLTDYDYFFAVQEDDKTLYYSYLGHKIYEGNDKLLDFALSSEKTRYVNTSD